MKRINTELSYSKNEDPDLVIKAWTCIHTGQHLIKHLAPESKNSKYYQLATPEQYETSWTKLETAFSKTIVFLKERFDLSNYQFIRGYNSIIVLANYFANHEIVDDQVLAHLSKWFIQSLILSRYSIRGTTRFREDIKATQEGKKLRDLFSHKYEPLDPQTFTLSDVNILNADFRSPYSTLLYILMRKSKAVDLYKTSLQVGEKLPDNQSWQFHHIFPDAKFNGKRQQIKDLIEEAKENGSEEDEEKSSGELIRLHDSIISIPNLAFLTPETNQSIQDSEPFDYLNEIMNRPNGKEILEAQMIPTEPSLWKLNKFEEFRKKRTELILQRINEYLTNENLI